MSGDAIRLDRFLLTREPFAGLGRRRLAALLDTGRVRVNGKPARKGTTVHAGDTITFRESEREPVPTDVAPALALLYEDADLVAVDKPPAVPTTIGRTPGPSVAAALLARFPEMAALDARGHAGLVHRLDTGTSGLLLAARTARAHATLRAAFAGKRVVKDYLAVVAGRVVGPQVVTQPLARHPRSRGRMIPARDDDLRAWPAATEIVPIGGDDAITIVRLRMRSGVTHQLRVHLAGLGHPILGDRRYGPPRGDQGEPDTTVPPWHYLHAWMIACDDGDVCPAIATPFPAHWRPLFAARGWSIPSA